MASNTTTCGPPPASVPVAKMLLSTTACVSGADVLAANLASPEYFAVMLWLPTDGLLFVRVATPFTGLGTPGDLVPWSGVPRPVGGPAMGGMPAAVTENVTAGPR